MVRTLFSLETRIAFVGPSDSCWISVCSFHLVLTCSEWNPHMSRKFCSYRPRQMFSIQTITKGAGSPFCREQEITEILPTRVCLCRVEAKVKKPSIWKECE